VRQPEQRAGEHERDPGPGPALHDPEEDAAEQQLLGGDGGGREAEEPHRTRDRAQAVDLVAAEEGVVEDDRPEQRRAEQHAPGGGEDGSPRGQLGDRAVLGPPHHPPVDDQRGHGGQDAGGQRQPRVALHRGDALLADEGDRHDGQ
jgi:hypothetical protein